MNKPCYHCHACEAAPGSNFCTGCSAGSRPLFYPRMGRERKVAFTALLYVGATAAMLWLIVKSVELWLKP